MIILDTNVLYELVKPTPSRRVVEWLDAFSAHQVATTSITAAELWYGVGRLPDGRRKNLLSSGVDRMLYEDLNGLIEVFDTSAASRYADIVVGREQRGRPIEIADAQIAAICASRNATLATRNVKDFEDTGIELFNPWEHG
jgi:toxin FitB